MLRVAANPGMTKGQPCGEGMSIATCPPPSRPQRAIFVILHQIVLPAQPQQIIEQTREDISSQMGRGIAACAKEDVVYKLPIDLTALAACFVQHMPTNGAAVVPVGAKEDGSHNLWEHNWRAQHWLADPVGGVLWESFIIQVQRANSPAVGHMTFNILTLLTRQPVDG